MKKILITIVLVFVNAISYGQVRQHDHPGITFDKIGNKFTNATGWAYCDDLQRWIDYKNVISTSLAFKRSRVAEAGTRSMDNLFVAQFTSMTCKSFVYENKRFYAIFISTWNMNAIYLFDVSYENMFNVNNEEVHCLKGLKLRIPSGGDIRDDWTEEEFAFYLARNWNNWIDNPYSTSEQVKFQYKKEGDNIRFLIDSFLRFDWFYFETSISNFSILLP